MASVHWAGCPFIDAGLAAIGAVTGRDLSTLTPDDLAHAARELRRILLSDQALGVGVTENFATSSLGHLFFNSELHNPSNWRRGKTPEEKANYVRQKFTEALQQDLDRARRCLTAPQGKEVCHACGRRCPPDAMLTVRKDRVPLLGSIVNFYPAFAYGVRVCGLCALAVRFLPMAVMRSGKRLWFLHTQSLPIATRIARHYGWDHFNRLIARNEALDFYGEWETAGDEAIVLDLLFELLEEMGDQLRDIYQSPLPATAYLFSNHAQTTFIHALPVPNEILRYLARLHLESVSGFQQFRRELLQVPSGWKGKDRRAREDFVRQVANRILNLQPILRPCLDDETPKLRGGWVGHRLYLSGVMKVPKAKLALLERLGLQIAQSEDAKKRIAELQTVRRSELYGKLLRYVREGWLTHEEFYFLLPPNDYGADEVIRDVLLAVIYEWQHCAQEGKEFPLMKEEPSLPSPDETLQRIQEIGTRLLGRLPNPKRWIGELQTAKDIPRIRGVYLGAVRSGALRFPDFIFLAPLDDRSRIWLLRDYLLAFLFDRAKEALPEEEEITVGTEEPFEGGEA